MKKFLISASFVFIASAASAQVHPCDTTPTSVSSVNINQAFTLGWCHDAKDVKGLPTVITGWRLYRNKVLVPSPTIVVGTANAAGMTYYSAGRVEAIAGSYTYEISAMNSAGESVHSVFIALTVALPALASAPALLRTSQP